MHLCVSAMYLYVAVCNITMCFYISVSIFMFYDYGFGSKRN